MTDAVLVVNYVMLFAGAAGFLSYPVLEHFYEPDVSGWKLISLLGIAFASVLFGAGIWTGGVDLVPVRALAAVSLITAEFTLVKETIGSSK